MFGNIRLYDVYSKIFSQFIILLNYSPSAKIHQLLVKRNSCNFHFVFFLLLKQTLLYIKVLIWFTYPSISSLIRFAKYIQQYPTFTNTTTTTKSNSRPCNISKMEKFIERSLSYCEPGSGMSTFYFKTVDKWFSGPLITRTDICHYTYNL